MLQKASKAKTIDTAPNNSPTKKSQKAISKQQNQILKKQILNYIRRKRCVFLLCGLLCIWLFACHCMMRSLQKGQRNSILNNAADCSAAMDRQISRLHPDFSDADSTHEFLTSGIGLTPLSSGSSALAVLSEGQLLFVLGDNVLSHTLVENVAKKAKKSPSIYTYHNINLPDFYFYVITSKVSELDYCYFEPAKTGWQLVQQGIPMEWILVLAVLSLATIVTFRLFIAVGLTKLLGEPAAEIIPPENAEKEAAPPAKSKEEAVFGSLPYFSGIIIDYHNTRGKPVNPQTLKLFDQIIRENLSVNKILYQISVQQGSDCLQYYMNYTNYNLRVLCDSLKMNLFNADHDYMINIFYGTAVPTCQEMENELLYLHRNLRYSLILGYGNRFSIEYIKELEASTAVLDANVASTIQNHLRTRAYEDLYTYLAHYKDIFNHPRSTAIRYSFAQVYRFAEEAFSVIKLFFQENSFEHPMVQTTCITILRSNPGLNPFCKYLSACIRTYQRENDHVLSPRNEEIMNNIYMFIEQDLGSANLNSIAFKMQMTNSHLSRVFKKNTGLNFSEYLSERKLEEAAKLLVQDQKMKVADISDMLGYGNPNYFLSRFKAKYGVSPSVYRKEHVGNLIIKS